MKRPISGQRGFEYHLTPAGKELEPVIESLVVWGMRWARDELRSDEMDVAFLMFDVERNIKTEELPGGESVLCFQFSDLNEYKKWWIVCEGNSRDLCYEDPGKDVSAYISTTSHELVGIWMGDVSLSDAITNERITVFGDSVVCRRFKKWFSALRGCSNSSTCARNVGGKSPLIGTPNSEWVNAKQTLVATVATNTMGSNQSSERFGQAKSLQKLCLGRLCGQNRPSRHFYQCLPPCYNLAQRRT